jgi:AcrR family transcriptional regulator
METATEIVDGRRARGDESRRALLALAVQQASIDGLDGISLGRLAAEGEVSKSGVATLFGSKERLQLAVVEAASELFRSVVIDPARTLPRGAARVAALAQRWLDYSRTRVFDGGCFFIGASVDFDAKPGAVRDAVIHALASWDGYLTASIQHAMDLGELPGLDDAAQLAFELQAIFDHSNTISVLLDSEEPYRRASRAIADRLRGLGADDSALAELSG